jgi:hypothetical protein
MTKYTIASQRRAVNAQPQVHPIWRGVGCIMFVVIPVVSFVLSIPTVDLIVNNNWPMPYQLMGQPVLPSFLMKSEALAPIVLLIGQQENLYAKLLITVVYVVVIGAAVSFAYAFVYRFVGPPRYGPLDARPEEVIGNRKIKRYKR